jgi:hypothetical protein
MGLINDLFIKATERRTHCTRDGVIASCAAKASKSGICDLPFEIPSLRGFAVVIPKRLYTG